MKSFVRHQKNPQSRWLKAAPFGLVLLLLCRAAGAQTMVNLFEVGANGVNDPLVNYLPQIYATNFVNGVSSGSQFSYTQQYTGSQNWFYALNHNWYNTLNFTNVGEMDSVTGFTFDTQPYPVANDRAAASFYNVGSINCGTYTNAIFLYQYGFSYIGGVYSGGYGGYGGFNAWATNIFTGNNSVINVGAGGLARFGGNNVVFSNATVNIEGTSGVIGAGVGNVSANGQAAINTNAWPIAYLQPSYAVAPMNSSPYGISLFPSVPYYQQTGNASNVTVKMIFLEDTSVNVATNIYINGNQNFANGEGTVEWVGTYTNPVTGQAGTHYLYLNDNYVGSAATNILSFGNPGVGVPNNYVIQPSATQLSGLGNLVPFSSYYPNLDTNDVITNNIYSYVNAQLIPTTTALNGSSGAVALTNVPGRIEITASNALTLAKASFAGMSYLRLNSTNQFSYDGRNQVAAPYADFYLGSTNGNMTITNLIEPTLPVWSGSVQAYSTRWTNTVGGTNYDFRALLVRSQLSPLTASSIQDFVLYCTNNVVISDVLNITRTFSLNCTNLLLTTNVAGSGAASPDGELNLGSAVTNWQYAVPRLSCLTNNGAIRLLRSAVFGSSSAPYVALFNTGLIRVAGGMTVNSADFENYGTIIVNPGAFAAQTLTTTMTNAVLQAGTSVSLAASNLVVSGTSIQCGGSLTLSVTNLLTDGGVNSSNFWSLGTSQPGYGNPLGLSLLVKPTFGDLLGTTITNVAAVANSQVINTWAGLDRGYTVAGFQDNAAIGQLVLDAQTNTTQFYFTGTSTDGTTNAIYVDRLILKDYAGYYGLVNSGYLPGFSFNSNLVIYYADAIDRNYGSVAEKINGLNGGHLRWVPNYAGYFSTTNIVYPDGTTNAINASLAHANDMDSDRDGNNNATDPTPVFVPSQVQLTVAPVNVPPWSMKIAWHTIPLAGNCVYYSTNAFSTNWLPFTNFNSYYYGPGIAVPNPAHTNYFVSPQPYINSMTPSDNWEVTNVWVLDPVTPVPHYYRVMVKPN